MNEPNTIIAGLIITGVLTFLTTLATLIFQLIKDSRDRAWSLLDREDRQRVAINQASAAQKLHESIAENTHLAISAAQRSDVIEAKTDSVVAQVKTNAELTNSVAAQVKTNAELTKQGAQKASDAYDAANSFNEKVRELEKAQRAIEEMQRAILEIIKQDRERSLRERDTKKTIIPRKGKRK